jgi:two-component system sensor histidine kinase CpxA
MKARNSISIRILLLAFLNVLLLVVIFVVFVRIQFRVDLSSFLLTPARDKILSVSRLIALELPDSHPNTWNQLLERYGSSYPARFYLFTSSGDQIAGDSITLPNDLMEWIRHDHPEFFDRSPHAPGPPVFLLHRKNPAAYWVGVHIPIRNAAVRGHLRGTVVWRFSSLWTNPFFFNYKPWLGALIAIMAVSIACWLPLIRDLTRSIKQLTSATGHIAEGHFEVQLPTNRRDELGHLSESIQQMSAKLSDLLSGQKRFLSDVAHELCSPIARIQVALGILEQRAEPGVAQYVADLQEEVQHMSGLVNELLAFSKTQISSERPAPERVNVAEIVERVIQRECAESSRPVLDVDSSIEVEAYPDYLHRSLANLIRNANRYAAGTGPVTVSARELGDQVSITVADHGPGLPEGELENVFRPFYRPELARQRETGGVGLGLAIVRRCIEACGGTVRCRNREPHGLEVEIRLSAATKEASTKREESIAKA